MVQDKGDGPRGRPAQPVIVARAGRRFEFDPSGFFYIYIRRPASAKGARPRPGEGEIVAEHYLNVAKQGAARPVATGRVDKVISGKRADELCDTIFRLGLVSRLDHAMYLGRELERAQRALEAGGRYEQDEDE